VQDRSERYFRMQPYICSSEWKKWGLNEGFSPIILSMFYNCNELLQASVFFTYLCTDWYTSFNTPLKKIQVILSLRKCAHTQESENNRPTYTTIINSYFVNWKFKFIRCHLKNDHVFISENISTDITLKKCVLLIPCMLKSCLYYNF